MKNKQSAIQQYGLTTFAKAGVAIMNLNNKEDKEEHDIHAPHRDNHYLLMFATSGTLRINIDFKEKAITTPSMLIIFPGQVHSMVNYNSLQGWALSFDPSLMDEDMHFFYEKAVPCPLVLNVETAFYQQMVTLMALIEQMLSGIPNRFTSRSVHNLLAAIISTIAGEVSLPDHDDKMKENRGAIIEQGFSQLLRKHYKEWKQPARYASALSITVTHLNDTVKKITGRPISLHIQQRSILEAKRLLYLTELSVKEISYELGYDDPVYFGKLFRKTTGNSPKQFRQQFREQFRD
ncbi:AraC family transcriptional regulator [Chitinophaga sp. 30R24]|uniref:AraC family transcriptional regulator n=1 Tax=Chitinophaga sp. 30R24 TaxID=3248838 RepID=UPI003B907A03